MCNPVAIMATAAAASTLGGMAASSQAASAQDRANANAINAQTARDVQAAREARDRQQALNAESDRVRQEYNQQARDLNASQIQQSAAASAQAAQAAEADRVGAMLNEQSGVQRSVVPQASDESSAPGIKYIQGIMDASTADASGTLSNRAKSLGALLGNQFSMAQRGRDFDYSNANLQTLGNLYNTKMSPLSYGSSLLADDYNRQRQLNASQSAVDQYNAANAGQGWNALSKGLGLMGQLSGMGASMTAYK